MKEIKTASVLAFERKLTPSNALMYAGDWDGRAVSQDWPAIAVNEKAVRGTISNRLKAKAQEPEKINDAISNPNLQTVDTATLPAGADTLKLQFTLRVLGGTGHPSGCNNENYQKKLEQTVSTWRDEHGFGELARRYAYNLANGRFLWRNRIGAEQIEVNVVQLVNGEEKNQWTFDALDLSLYNFEASGKAATNLAALAKLIASGLQGDEQVLLQVTAFARLGAGQEVFPSQELILDRGRSNKSKTLYTVAGSAALHSQKVGNALRTIDTWYPKTEEGEGPDTIGPIAVEPYGSVTSMGRAFRQPRKSKDFYSLLDNWVLKNKTPEIGDQHFVIAVLIRGGVFGEAG